MVFGRTFRTKLPELYQLDATCTEIHYRDKEKNAKGKMCKEKRARK
jgi:hypothetical protein